MRDPNSTDELFRGAPSFADKSVALDDPTHEGHEHQLEWTELTRIVLVALAAAAVWFHVWEAFPRVS